MAMSAPHHASFRHPAVRAWFESAFAAPTMCQARAWARIRDGDHTLIAAPTGSGKTLAAFLSILDELAEESRSGTLDDAIRVIYVSPLKALSYDIERNLETPLRGIEAEAERLGEPPVAIRTAVRTGDTPAAARQAMLRHPPHILVTTPESLYLLLTSESGRTALAARAHTVIVDEIHALAGNKRGAHLALTLERLEALRAEAAGSGHGGAAPPRLRRIGLSATQRPMDLIARFLIGGGGDEDDNANAPEPRCAIIDEGFQRERDLALELPSSPLTPVMANEVWDEVYDRIATLAREHRTTLVFANTRRLAERAARALAERLGENEVTSHHGSLSRERRTAAEQRLKSGALTVLVATASLELGIDIGDIDLVCQLGTTRNISTFLQRVGRSGHGIDGTPKGRLFPLSRDDLVECAALLDAARRGELDTLAPPEQPLDVLAQHIVAEVASREWEEEALFALVRAAWPWRALPRETFRAVVEMLASGFATRRGRRGAFLHFDRVNGRLRARRGARMTALTNGGAIADNADYPVVLEPSGALVGSLNEDFAIETLPGDIFQLGLHSWRILRVESDRVRVEDAAGQPPTIPFWIGEAPARSDELSGEVTRLRDTIGALVARGANLSDGIERAVRWATSGASGTNGENDVEPGLGLAEEAARQLVEYLATGQAALGAMPSASTLVFERFFDESGGMQLVIHAPLGGRVNRALGLALRKRFCRQFNFELQAAATEDNVVLSLGESHSFPLKEVAGYLSSASARDVLTQALLDAPLFNIRWRWNANVSLAVPRFSGGRKVPPPIQRMQAEDLIAVVFPDQIACAENLTAGHREIPDHPLVRQTIYDALHEAMDVDGLVALLARIEQGEVTVRACDLPEPSPFAHEILNAKPYAFLDDAPLEERRTRAVSARRWLDPESAADLGRLDPEAIERVREEAWPDTDSADALHDALVVLGFLTQDEMRRALGAGTAAMRDGADPRATQPLATLVRECRAEQLVMHQEDGNAPFHLWVAAERVPEMRAVHPAAVLELKAAPGTPDPASPEEALRELVRGRLSGLGPVTAATLAADAGVAVRAVDAALVALEQEGFALRGQFTTAPNGAGETETEWCERRLLARIHRYTLARLRQGIEPVEPADYMRFLFTWHGLDQPREGADALLAVLEQLEGFEAPLAAWEESILPRRLRAYDPDWLDLLCLTGRVVWFRRARAQGANGTAARSGGARPSGASTATPIAFAERSHLAAWWRPPAGQDRDDGHDESAPMSSLARRVHELLRLEGARFLDELKSRSGLLASQVEDGLAELVASGHVTADGFSALRTLVERHRRSGGRRRGAGVSFAGAGRWCLASARIAPDPTAPADALVERRLDILLRRYGVVFRKVLERESGLPPWRELVPLLRRREDRGEVRGGRFVHGFSGEQFALPEAVGALRRARRAPRTGLPVTLSAADPLNLTGIITPGPRVSSAAASHITWRDGVPDDEPQPTPRQRRRRFRRAVGGIDPFFTPPGGGT